MSRLATLRWFMLAVVVSVTCVGGLRWRDAQLGGVGTLDTRVWYTPKEAADVFRALDRHDPRARALYGVSELTLDMAFLAGYGLLFAIPLYRVFGERRPLYLVPVTLAAADLAENLVVATLALSFDGGPSGLAWLAAVFTCAKTALIVATLAAAAMAGPAWMRSVWRCRR